MYKLPVVILLIFGLISSCQKTNKDINKPIVYPNYTQLKVGNYWVYQKFKVDTNGIPTPINSFDSCYVVKDSVIRNETYYKVANFNTYENFTFLRDSLHYLISSTGKILFSSQDFTTVFYSKYEIWGNDTVGLITHKMVGKDSLVNTPAGSFLSSAYLENFKLLSKKYSGLHSTNTTTKFSKNIGVVTQIFDNNIGGAGYHERRLLRYKVQ